MLAESNRVEAFSDGVLAIAITLLVLDLHTAGRPGRVGPDLLHQWPTYLAYVASFMYIGVVWVNHHSLFTRIASVDGGLLWCNLGLLLTASVLPFPTAELAFAMGPEGTRGDKISALLLYAVVSAAMAVSWLIIFVYLQRHPRLLRPGVTAAFFRAERLRALAGISAAFVPVLVGLVAPLAALGFVVVMPVFYAATAEGLRSRHSASQDPPWPADEGGLELAARTWRPGLSGARAGPAHPRPGRGPGAVPDRRRRRAASSMGIPGRTRYAGTRSPPAGRSSLGVPPRIPGPVSRCGSRGPAVLGVPSVTRPASRAREPRLSGRVAGPAAGYRNWPGVSLSRSPCHTTATTSPGSITVHPVSRSRRTRPSGRTSTPVSRFPSAVGKATGPIWLTSMDMDPDLPIRGLSRSRIVSPVMMWHLQPSPMCSMPALGRDARGMSGRRRPR
jgi:uncharacterized membrane protein